MVPHLNFSLLFSFSFPYLLTSSSLLSTPFQFLFVVLLSTLNGVQDYFQSQYSEINPRGTEGEVAVGDHLWRWEFCIYAVSESEHRLAAWQKTSYLLFCLSGPILFCFFSFWILGHVQQCSVNKAGNQTQATHLQGLFSNPLSFLVSDPFIYQSKKCLLKNVPHFILLGCFF